MVLLRNLPATTPASQELADDNIDSLATGVSSKVTKLLGSRLTRKPVGDLMTSFSEELASAGLSDSDIGLIAQKVWARVSGQDTTYLHLVPGEECSVDVIAHKIIAKINLFLKAPFLGKKLKGDINSFATDLIEAGLSDDDVAPIAEKAWRSCSEVMQAQRELVLSL